MNTQQDFDSRAFLAEGSKPDHYITHDGAELHLRDIQVRLITRAPTHFPFVHSYAMVKKVMEDSPEEFHAMYEWRAVGNLESPLGAAPAETSLEIMAGVYYQKGKYLDFDGVERERSIPASPSVMLEAGKTLDVVYKQRDAVEKLKGEKAD